MPRAVEAAAGRCCLEVATCNRVGAAARAPFLPSESTVPPVAAGPLGLEVDDASPGGPARPEFVGQGLDGVPSLGPGRPQQGVGERPLDRINLGQRLAHPGGSWWARGCFHVARRVGRRGNVRLKLLGVD